MPGCSWTEGKDALDYYYRFAEWTLDSDLLLPSFGAFACEPAPADVTLHRTEEVPPEGRETVTGRFVHRAIPGGWYCHWAQGRDEGLFVSADHTCLRYRCGSGSADAASVEQLLRPALECFLARHGYVSLHGAAVEKDGQAVIFTGPSGVGKSARARAWTGNLGASLVSGDRPLVRADSPEVLGMPWDGKERCFRNVRLPLKAICEVRRGKSFAARRLSMAQARRLLAQQSFLPMWDTETAAAQMANVFRMASSGRILRVFGGKEKEDAEDLYAALRNGEYLGEERDMKVKPGFVLRKVVEEYMLMPTGENIASFNGAVLLNRVSAFIWEKLQAPTSRQDLLQAVLHEFDVDEDTAARDLDALLEKLDGYGILERE